MTEATCAPAEWMSKGRPKNTSFINTLHLIYLCPVWNVSLRFCCYKGFLTKNSQAEVACKCCLDCFLIWIFPSYGVSLTLPQALQWCLLLVNVNLALHLIQTGAWQSGTQWGASFPRDWAAFLHRAPCWPAWRSLSGLSEGTRQGEFTTAPLFTPAACWSVPPVVVSHGVSLRHWLSWFLFLLTQGPSWFWIWPDTGCGIWSLRLTGCFGRAPP